MTSSWKGTETMTVDTRDQRREIATFYEEVIRDLDRRLARIERTRQDAYRSVPAWRHLIGRRAYFVRLRAESLRRTCGSQVLRVRSKRKDSRGSSSAPISASGSPRCGGDGRRPDPTG